jgi:hypothetical protein
MNFCYTTLAEVHGITVALCTLGKWLRERRSVDGILEKPPKLHPGNVLGRLTRAKQELLYKECEKLTVKNAIVWLKEEHALEVNETALSRWMSKRREDLEFINRLQDIRDDRDKAGLVGGILGAAAEFSEANCVMISQAVFEELRKEKEDRDEVRLMKLMELALKADRSGLARTKFQYNAVRLARKHATELVEINGSNEDEETKIDRAMILLFGEGPSGDVTELEVATDEVTIPEEEA